MLSFYIKPILVVPSPRPPFFNWYVSPAVISRFVSLFWLHLLWSIHCSSLKHTTRRNNSFAVECSFRVSWFNCGISLSHIFEIWSHAEEPIHLGFWASLTPLLDECYEISIGSEVEVGKSLSYSHHFKRDLLCIVSSERVTRSLCIIYEMYSQVILRLWI